MPVYLVHGFRWPRAGFSGIRVHAIINNLDNVSVEYIQNANSRRDLLRSFRKAYPDIMKELDQSDPDNEVYTQPGLGGHGSRTGGGSGSGGRRLEFIEQYNPEDVDGPNAVSQPYAYVGDKVVVIAASPATSIALNGTSTSHSNPTSTQQPPESQSPTTSKKAVPRSSTSHSHSTSKSHPAADITALSVNVEEVIADGPGLTNKAWEALADLRDKIAEGEKIGWWVVYNGDPERTFDDLSDDDEGYDEEMEDVEEEDEEDLVQEEEDDKSEKRSATSAAAKKGHRPTASDNAPIPVSSTGKVPFSTQQQAQPHPQSQQQHVQHQHQTSSPGLTALPVRPSPPINPDPATQGAPANPRSRPNTAPSEPKGKAKDVPEDPAKLKETNKSQGLRRKFFGRRS